MIVQKLGLFAVMIGAMVLSFNGQVDTISPAVGSEMAMVFALVMDIAALLALHLLMTSKSAEVRAWAWAVLLVAGGTSLTLNTWHTMHTRRLPWGLAVLVGVVPVGLAGLLSHLFALSVRDASKEGGPVDGAPASAGAGEGQVEPAAGNERQAGAPATDRAAAPRAAAEPGTEAGGRRDPDSVSKAGGKGSDGGEITPDLLRRAAKLDVTARRGRAGYRVLKDQLGLSEPVAKRLRAALDEQQASASVIPIHRSADAPGERVHEDGGHEDAGWRSAGSTDGRHSGQVEEVAR